MFQKNEITEVCENLHKKRGIREQKKLELDSLQFHFDHIDRNKEIAADKYANLTLIVAPMFAFLILCFVFWIAVIIYINVGDVSDEARSMLGLPSLVTAMYIVFGGFALYKLSHDWFYLGKRLHISLDDTGAKNYSQIKGVTTYQHDKVQTKTQISILEEEINVLNKEIEELEEKEKRLIAFRPETLDDMWDRDKLQRRRKEYGDTYDTLKMAAEGEKESAFNLKENHDEDIVELDEYYASEINYIKKNLSESDVQMKVLNNRRDKIYVDFAQAKTRMIICFAAFFFVIILQNLVAGPAAPITSLVCIIASIITIVLMDKVVSKPIIFYLIEEESPLVSEYVLRCDITPVTKEIKELQDSINLQRENLKYCEEKRKLLDV